LLSLLNFESIKYENYVFNIRINPEFHLTIKSRNYMTIYD